MTSRVHGQRAEGAGLEPQPLAANVHGEGLGFALCEMGGGAHVHAGGLVLSAGGGHVNLRTHRRGSQAARPWSQLCPAESGPQGRVGSWGLERGGKSGPRGPCLALLWATVRRALGPQASGVGAVAIGDQARAGGPEHTHPPLFSPACLGWSGKLRLREAGELCLSPRQGRPWEVPGASPWTPKSPRGGDLLLCGVQSSRSLFVLNVPRARPHA